MPNLNDNPPELPDIPPAPPLDTPNYSNVPRPLPAPERVGVQLSDQTPLSLEDAIRLALENNNDIEIAGSDVKTAELDLTIARGGYIPQFVGEGFYQRSTTPVASTLSGSADGSLTETSFRSNMGLRRKSSVSRRFVHIEFSIEQNVNQQHFYVAQSAVSVVV